MALDQEHAHLIQPPTRRILCTVFLLLDFWCIDFVLSHFSPAPSFWPIEFVAIRGRSLAWHIVYYLRHSISCSNVHASLGMLVPGEGVGDEKWAVPL